MNPFVSLWSRKRILRKGRLTGCMVLIALVTAPLVIALIFSRSMMLGIADRFIYLSDGHVQISGSSHAEYPADNILSIDETVTGYALMYGAQSTSSVSLKGVKENYFNEGRLRYMDLEYLPEENRPSLNRIILSSHTAEKLNVKSGDRVALMVVPDTDQGVLRPVMLQVGGVYSSGYEQIDSNLAFIDYDYALKLFFSDESRVTEILLKDSSDKEVLSFASSVSTDGIVNTWQNKNYAVYSNFVNSRQMIILILLIIVFIASFFTASAANQIIEDDIPEIAVSKLMGASDAMTRQSAFISIYTVTLTGMLIGLAVGILTGLNLSPVLKLLSKSELVNLSYYLMDFIPVVPWGDIALVLAVMTLVSALSIFISLRHTRRITPMRLFTGL